MTVSAAAATLETRVVLVVTFTPYVEPNIMWSYMFCPTPGSSDIIRMLREERVSRAPILETENLWELEGSRAEDSSMPGGQGVGDSECFNENPACDVCVFEKGFPGRGAEVD